MGVHPDNTNNYFKKGGGRAALFGGYGLESSWKGLHLFSALEAFAQFSPYSITKRDSQVYIEPPFFEIFTATTTTSTRTKINVFQPGVDIRLGVLLSPWSMVYGAVGTSAAWLHTQTHAQFSTPAGETLDLSISKRATKATLRAGGGVEGSILGKWHLRLDYRFTDYGSLRVKGLVANPTSPIGPISLSVKSQVHPKDHAVTLGITRYL